MLDFFHCSSILKNERVTFLGLIYWTDINIHRNNIKFKIIILPTRFIPACVYYDDILEMFLTQHPNQISPSCISMMHFWILSWFALLFWGSGTLTSKSIVIIIVTIFAYLLFNSVLIFYTNSFFFLLRYQLCNNTEKKVLMLMFIETES